MKNGPKAHLHITDGDNIYLHDFEIPVDPWRINYGIFKFLWWFPFNTDGVDVAASNVLIERVNITNFDDAVAIKRSGGKNEITK